MRRRLILAALAALPVRAWAITALSAGQVLRGRFVQERHLHGFDAPLRTEGRFVLAPGRGLIWRAETPFAITTVITTAGLVQDVDGTETMRLPAARLPFLGRLYGMLSGALSGDWRGLEPDFVVVRSGTRRIGAPISRLGGPMRSACRSTISPCPAAGSSIRSRSTSRTGISNTWRFSIRCCPTSRSALTKPRCLASPGR